MSQRLPRFNRMQEQAEDRRKLSQILLESGERAPIETVSRATLPGDTRRLRGIPVVGFGIGGTAPGTDPLGAAIRADLRSIRFDL